MSMKLKLQLQMQGRQKALLEQDDKSSFTMDVPQVALLNCCKFELVN